MPRARTSSRTDCEKPSSANLLMQYALQFGKPVLAAIESQAVLGGLRFFRNGAADAATRAGDTITLHRRRYSHRKVNRLFAVRQSRRRTSRPFRRESNRGQSARTIFAPVEGLSRNSSI